MISSNLIRNEELEIRNFVERVKSNKVPRFEKIRKGLIFSALFYYIKAII